jgi:serine protease Do
MTSDAIPEPAAPTRAVLGLRTVPATEVDRLQHGAPSRQGAMVLAIAAGSPAHLAGIPLTSIVVAIDGKTVSGPTDLARRIATYEPGDEIEVSFYYKREHIRRRLVLADSYAVSDAPSTAPPTDRAAAEPHAPRSGDATARIAALEAQVEALTRRVAELERVAETAGQPPR